MKNNTSTAPPEYKSQSKFFLSFLLNQNLLSKGWIGFSLKQSAINPKNRIMSATSILRKPSKDPAKNESASSSVEHPSASEARSGTNAPEDENTEEKDIPSPTRPVERRVSFDPTTKAPNNEIGIQKPVLTSRRHSRSARVGKADPIRDFGILSAIFLLLYFVSSGFNNILSNDDGEMVTGGDNKMSSMQTLEMALAQMLEARQKKYPINDDCALFYAPSSIPKTGWGVFAGKNLTSGVKLMVRVEIMNHAVLCSR